MAGNNPSRKQCEEIIRRILMTEVLEKGTNQHFKTAADFMKYFESLYPASDALTKQVQRAVKALNMPKDDGGYYIINKSAKQLDQDREISFMMKKSNASIYDLEEYETLFLACDAQYQAYLLQIISESDTFKNKYITIISSSNGLLFYTQNKQQLRILINSLIEKN